MSTLGCNCVWISLIYITFFNRWRMLQVWWCICDNRDNRGAVIQNHVSLYYNVYKAIHTGNNYENSLRNKGLKRITPNFNNKCLTSSKTLGRFGCIPYFVKLHRLKQLFELLCYRSNIAKTNIALHVLYGERCGCEWSCIAICFLY